MKYFTSTIMIVGFSFLIGSCRKLISVPPPVGDLVASQVFSSNEEATSAASGMYFELINSYESFSSGGISVFAGMSADELLPFDQNYSDQYVQFQKNELTPTTGMVNSNFWSNPYSVIYRANAVIEGLQNNSGVQDSIKNELIGEAEFVRAFCNFYLVNLFGDIPLVTTIKYQKTNLLGRSNATDVYQLILTDLNDAVTRLASDYSVGGQERIVPNKWAAMSLLARVYLYRNNWQEAFAESDSVIKNSSLYGLVNDLNSVFLSNSNEAIWQLKQSNTTPFWYNVTPEGFLLLPGTLTSNNGNTQPFAYLTDTLLNTFEPGDQRKANWVDSINYKNSSYYVPYKYKVGASSASANGTYLEYYMVLRLSEQYLIRAEAQEQLGNSAAAVSDLNVIRNRAGLGNYGGSLESDSLLNAIYHERQVELFVEWGNRWFDLKRTGRATAVLTQNKGYAVTDEMLLYPIPYRDLQTDPNLVQNKGY